MLTMLVVTRSYSGNLMSLLAVKYVSQPFQTLRDILDDNKIISIWQRYSSNEQFLRVSIAIKILKIFYIPRSEHLPSNFLCKFLRMSIWLPLRLLRAEQYKSTLGGQIRNLLRGGAAGEDRSPKVPHSRRIPRELENLGKAWPPRSYRCRSHRQELHSTTVFVVRYDWRGQKWAVLSIPDNIPYFLFITSLLLSLTQLRIIDIHCLQSEIGFH